MAFEDNIDAYSQEHFTIIEIDLPVVNGACTVGGSSGYGTPLTCDQPSNGTFTHRFTMQSSPLLPISNVWRCVKSISETPTELQSGRGLASRGSLSISFDDFIGDPNPLAPGVTDQVKKQGSFFGKLDARNILQNRDMRIKNYRIVNGVMPDLDNDAQVRHYIVESFSNSGKGVWKISAKDELSRVNLDEKTWPIQYGGYLRGSLTASTTTLGVDPLTPYAADDVVRIGEELMTVVTATNIQTASAALTVRTRGFPIANPPFSTRISSTETPSEKSAGDEVFLCRVFDGANIADVLYTMLTDVGIDPVYIPLSDWYAEIAEWHSNTLVTALYTESDDVNNQLSQFLQSYLLDMWFDPVAREIKLSAINVWKQSAATLSEGREIDFDSVRRQEVDDLRATTATIVFDKPFKARDDATENYRKASVYNDPKLETLAYYGESKQKLFDNNPIISDAAANLLTQRYISRYGITPQRYQWLTQERFLTFNTGDVVDVNTSAKQSPDGSQAPSQRAQILSIKPNYNKIGRDYTIKALTYEPAFDTGSAVIIDFNPEGLNIYDRYYNASLPVELTVIFDGVQSGSSSANVPSIRAGNFPIGSKLIIILANGADLQAKGGDGGRSGDGEFDFELNRWLTEPPSNGTNGGIVFDADGVDCDIYFSGATPNTDYPVADGYIRAPGGGGGSRIANIPQLKTGDSGGGGAGRRFGVGGDTSSTRGQLSPGAKGQSGNESGTGGAGGGIAGKGGNWGQNGSGSSSQGGLAGSGVVDSGGTVNFFGSNSIRYINGRGDH